MYLMETLSKRIKSFLWRAFGVSFVAMAGYALQIGDIWSLDIKVLINTGAIVLVGLVLNEVTKYLNTQE